MAGDHEITEAALKKEIAGKSAYIVGGGAKDYASYTQAVGEIRGLSQALEILEDLAKNKLQDGDYE